MGPAPKALALMPRILPKQRAAMAVVLAVAMTGLGVYAVVRSTRSHDDDPSRAVAATRAGASERESSVAPSTAQIAQGSNASPRIRDAAAPANDDAPASADGVDRVAALRRGLASEDEATRIAAVEAAVGQTAVETLDDLEKFELARDPETAPTVIHAVALLGASAEGKQREGAAGTLERWLRDELKRDGPDVLGNVSNIVEALGDVGGRQAVDALGAALDRGEIALHVQTLAVQKLGELGDAHARGPVERFARRVGSMPPGEGLDEELRVEAIEAARATLSRI
jgi:hypothetical protein